MSVKEDLPPSCAYQDLLVSPELYSWSCHGQAVRVLFELGHRVTAHLVSNHGLARIGRFYGLRENKLEVERDMREMVQRVKDGEPLYGKSSLSVHMQGVASRNSRYTGVFLHVVPWANFVNHQQVISSSILHHFSH